MIVGKGPSWGERRHVGEIEERRRTHTNQMGEKRKEGDDETKCLEILFLRAGAWHSL